MSSGSDSSEMAVSLPLYLGGALEKSMKASLCSVKGLEFSSCGFLMALEI